MTGTALLLIGITLVVGTAAAWLETAGRPGYGVLKMLAASGYLLFAIRLGAFDTLYGTVIFVALALCWLGDLFLIGEARAAFVAGLGAFLLGHVAYGAAFALEGLAPARTGFGAAAMVVVGVVVFRWLRRAELPRPLVTPVAAYLVAIGVMVAFAVGTGSALASAGAAAFAVSDVFVARHRFVRRETINRRLGLPLYFIAQLLLAATV